MKHAEAIPHVIHYCWFGGNPLPESALKCIESWKKYCPGYEIKEWNESNYDFNACAYVREAYQEKKWAFVSDYARFEILYAEGGLYFDTDVELIRPIDDVVQRGAFLGAEQSSDPSKGISVAPGLGMGAAPGHPVYKEILTEYQTKRFINEDGSHNRITIVDYTTQVLRKYNLTDSQEIQCVEGIHIYPWDYFCPLSFQTGVLTITDNTRSIHQYSSTWLTPQEQVAHQLKLRASKLLGERMGNLIFRVYSFPYRAKMKVKHKGLWGTLRFMLSKIIRK